MSWLYFEYGYLALGLIFLILGSVFDVALINAFVLGMSLYALHSIGIYQWTDFPFMIEFVIVYLGIGVLFSFFYYWLYVKSKKDILEKKIKEYEDYCESESLNLKFKNFDSYYSQYTSIYDRVDLKTGKLEHTSEIHIYENILFWWAKLIKIFLKDFVIYIIDKCKNIYNYISYITLKNTLAKIDK